MRAPDCNDKRGLQMSLKQQTVSGVGWNGAGNVARQLLQIVTLLVMARYLAPQDFGLFAVLTIFINFAQVLGNMSTSQVVVHLDDPDPRLLSSLFYLNVGLGAGLFAGLSLVAWPLSRFYGEPRLVGLLQALSVSFVFSGLGNVQRSLLEKAMRFRRVVVIEIAALAASCAIGVGLAASGYGIDSLVAMSVFNAAALHLGLAAACGWRPGLVFSWEDIRRVWGYTSHLTGFDLVNFFARNADAFLIGKFIGAAGLGLYSLAYRVMLYPLDNISRVIIRVLFPAFSQLKHDNERFRNAYLKAICLIAMVTFPAMAGLVATAENLVQVAFDPRWTGLAPLIMILAPVGMVQSIVSSVGVIYTAKGTTRLLLKVGLVNSAVIVASFAAGIPFGVEGVASFYALATFLVTYPTLRISWAQIDLPAGQGLRALTPFLVAATTMSIFVWTGGKWLAASGVALPLVLVTQICVGAVFYSSYLYLAHRSRVMALINDIVGR